MTDTIKTLATHIEAIRRAHNALAPGDREARADLLRKMQRLGRSLSRELYGAELVSCYTPGAQTSLIDLYRRGADLETATPIRRIAITDADCAAVDLEAL